MVHGTPYLSLYGIGQSDQIEQKYFTIRVRNV